MHNIAQQVALYCWKKAWIREDQIPWLVYALERRFLSSLFYISALFIGFVSDSLFEIVAFLVPFLFFRSRVGGWHAPTTVICFLTSLIVLGSSVFIVKPILTTFPLLVTILNAVSLFLLFVSHPLYPDAANFDTDVIAANNKLKQRAILPFSIIQLILLYFSFDSFVCSFLAVIAVLALLFIQFLLISKRRKKHEFY